MLSIATRPSRPLWPLGLAFLQRRHRQAVAYKLVLGQASAFETPHLVKPHELTPGITASEYQARREALMALLPEQSLVVVPGHPLKYMSADIPYPFRQHSDLSYLCGFQEPDSILLIRSGSRGSPVSMSLVVPPKDANREMWDGPRTGVIGAQQVFGAGKAYSNTEVQKAIGDHIADAKAVYYDHSEPSHPDFHKTIVRVLSGRRIESLQRHVHNLRSIKSKGEIEIMAEAGRISSLAFIETMRATRPGVSEHELDSIMEHACRRKGCRRLAYPPVVASGNSCNTLHYIANNKIIRDGDLVLMDAGGELHDYASDITRTWPVNGRFSPAQAEVYSAVLSAQCRLIEMCLCDGRMNLDQLHRHAVQLLGRELQALGILPSDASDHDLSRYTPVWYPHHTSHYLGMDTHDTGLVPRSRPLQPGHVVTVEPGLYFDKDDHRVPERYRGIGVRIEDDVLVTEQGPIVLTADCPKQIHDIEAIMAG